METQEHRDQQIITICAAARQLPPADRDAFLREVCGTDETLYQEVAEVLGREEAMGDFLLDPLIPALAPEEQPFVAKPDMEAAGAPAGESPEEIGAVIGGYHLLEQLGEGGMGVVWLAEQRQPVRRRVAVKLVKAGMDTREVVARFASERQALALMDHPAVAKVFDAGSTSAGRPYFVMEYVPGSPITDYCDRHRLSVRERLQLFIQVCEGANHAHQKAIIHRDLKPSNILVSEVDGKPVPRIIDFGVAKAISQPLTEITFVTRVGAVVGTWEYMSPEQADSGGEDIDTRTDVYSLGVILYELLVGTVPLHLKNLAFSEVLRKLREEEAPRPSTKIRTLGKGSAAAAENRRTEPKALGRLLHGDLDSIVLKALEKDRTRRYGSPSELAADLGRYLQNQPVAARPASAGYRARKYIRRHRIGVAAVAGLTILLVAGITVSTWMAIRANRSRQQAIAIESFLETDVLAQASVEKQSLDGSRKPDPQLTVRTALDRAAAKIEGKFGKQPSIEAAIRNTMGNAYRDLGAYAEAQHQYERALSLNNRIANRNRFYNSAELGMLYLNEGKYADAEKLMTEAVKNFRRIYGNDGDALVAEQRLAVIYHFQGKYAQAEALDSEVLNIQRRRLGENHPTTLSVENDLIGTYVDEHKYAQAEPLYQKLVEALVRVQGEESHDALAVIGNLGELYGFEGKFAEAESSYGRAANGMKRLEGPNHQDTLIVEEGLAWAYDHEGKYHQSDALFAEVLETEGRVFGKQHPITLITMTDMATSYRRRGMYRQAEALLVRTLEGRRLKLGAAHPDTLATLGDLGWIYVIVGKYQAAEPLVREAKSVFEKTSSDDWQRYRVECALGAILASQKQYAQAEPLLVEGYQKMLERKAAIAAEAKPELEQAGTQIVKLYRDWGKPEKAAEWLEKLRNAGLNISLDLGNR